jgi:hypothetical protein
VCWEATHDVTLRVPEQPPTKECLKPFMQEQYPRILMKTIIANVEIFKGNIYLLVLTKEPKKLL